MKLTAKGPENGWLEYFLVSFSGPAYFQGLFAVRFTEGFSVGEKPWEAFGALPMERGRGPMFEVSSDQGALLICL